MDDSRASSSDVIDVNARLVAPRDAPVKDALVKKETAIVSKRGKVRGTVYLLLDCSASMGSDGKLEQLKRGSLRFFSEAWQRDYAVGAIYFGSSAACLLGATRNFHHFQKQIMRLGADGRTAMDSAIRLGTWRLRFKGGYRAMILITDGQPDYPEATVQAARIAQRLGIELIAVGTSGADEAFLSSLTPKPELANIVAVRQLEEGIANTVKALPRAES
jgi:Mg-chelatase subunit ChlD